MIPFLMTLFCVLIPLAFAIVATWVSLNSLRCHISRRQLVFTAFVLVANAAGLAVISRDLLAGDFVSAAPVALICFSLVFSFIQFAVANFFGAIGRLRQKLA